MHSASRLRYGERSSERGIQTLDDRSEESESIHLLLSLRRRRGELAMKSTDLEGAVQEQADNSTLKD